MKILLLTTHLEMGGIGVYVTSLARGLKRRGHEPVVVSSGGCFERRLREDGIAHHRVPCRTSSELNSTLWLAAFPMLLGIAHRQRPQLIHAHTRVTQVLAWALSHTTGIPYVTTCHGLYRFRIGRRLFRCWGQRVMAISKTSFERLVRQYKLAPPHQVVLIENGIEVERFLEAAGKPQVARFKEAIGLKGHPIVGAVARLSPIKGLDTLLKTIPRLLTDFPNLQLLLVGDGPAKADLIECAYALQVADHVVIAHPVEDTRVPLAAMDLFVAPSLREGFGLAIVEAMAAGVPVVASNAGGPAEIIEEGHSGLLVAPAQPQELEQAIRTLLADPTRAGRMAEEARQRALRHFSMERVVGEVEKVYERAIA